VRILVSLLPAYPASAPPQLQLLSRYIGAFGVDATLFGAVLRTYMSNNGGVDWTPGAECVFDGIQNAVERCVRWYEDRLSAEKAGEMLREEMKEMTHPPDDTGRTTEQLAQPQPQRMVHVGLPEDLPPGLELVEAEPITDRRSAFVGRACRISDPSQVQLFVILPLSFVSTDETGPRCFIISHERSPDIAGSASYHQCLALPGGRSLVPRSAPE
jgi:hypothetical protein